MNELAGSAYSKYINAKPFPHLVLDNFFDPQIVDSVLAEFPQPDAIRWQNFDNAREIKQRLRDIGRDFLPPIIARQLRRIL